MSEHRIPKERLNQIARRKLLALGIQTRQAPDGVSLVGEIVIQQPMRCVNPFDGQPVTRIGFGVEGHDSIRITSPAVFSGMEPQPFFDFEKLAPLVAQMEKRLQQRAAAVRLHGEQLEKRGIEVSLDTERGRVVARVDLDGVKKAVLEGDERGLRAVRVEKPGGAARELGEVAIRLDDFSDNTDLSLFLDGLQERAAGEGAQAPPAARDAAVTKLEIPAAGASVHRGIQLGQLVEAFGPTAVVGSGLSIGRDLNAGDKTVRFSARHEQAGVFSGRLVTPEGTAWKGSFDLGGFPGLEDFVAGKLGTAQVVSGEPARVQAVAGGDQEEMVLGYQLPVAGEVWVMNILVEDENDAEIRYVGVDVDGKPYGAPRVLPRESFLQAFSKVAAGSYRLLVEVLEVELGKVSYSRLDNARRRSGQPISCRLAPFVSNFVPEAAAY